MKTKLLTMFIAFFATAMWAQEAQKSDSKIIVWLKGGATT